MSHTDFNGQFLFTPPAKLSGSSDLAYTSIVLASLAERLALEDREKVSHRGGRAENVAEHSFMLALLAPVLAERFYPELDANLVARFAAVHDTVEAYVGDTPTHSINQDGMADKAKREEQGLAQLLQDFRDFPAFSKIVADYESQQIPEARFVRVVDKLLPLLVHFAEGGTVLRGYIDPAGIRANSQERAQQLREEYPEFETLISGREELAELACKHLF